MSGRQGPERPRTLFEKVWLPHVAATLDGGPDVLAVDLHLIHEATSLEAFEQLSQRDLAVRRPDRTLAVMDHVVPVRTSTTHLLSQTATRYLNRLASNTAAYGIPCLPYGHRRQGIVHVVGPELGLTLPGMTIVCGDSHTSTHGALGAVAFGIGTTQVAHVLAEQAVLIDRPKTMSVTATGRLAAGVTSKDLALALIARFGNLAGAGHAVEFRGPAILALPVEARMTLCNMGVEFGSRMAMVAPDDVTIGYIARSVRPPTGRRWEAAVEHWKGLASDPGASYDTELVIGASDLRPHVSWGTTPAHAAPIDGVVPDPATLTDTGAARAARRALDYMGLRAGTPLRDITIDAAFIGSCTNARIEDLRSAAAVLDGRRLAPGVTGLVAPGSSGVRARAEAEGLDRVFTRAGFTWGGAGCSMCIAANGEVLPPGTRVASTTNRNFEGRQGTGVRTHLMSPAAVAASAVTGRLTDPRDLGMGE